MLQGFAIYNIRGGFPCENFLPKHQLEAGYPGMVISDKTKESLMIDLNNVTISANVAREPKFKTVGEDQKTVMGMRIAYNDRNDRGHFFNVEAWNGVAKSCKNLAKGSRIIVEGRLAQDTWTDEHENKRTAVKIVAARIHFVNKPKAKSADDVPFD